MESKRYVKIKNNIVYDCCMWDGDLNTWSPPNDGTIMMQSEYAGIGDMYVPKHKKFYRPLPTDEEL